LNFPLNTQSSLDLLKVSVDERISAAVLTVESLPLRSAVAHAVAGGKRLRSLLAMLACAAAGGRELDAQDAGVAIELLHGASLIHDDIMDGSELRRGAVTLHVKHGFPAAILAGDTLIALAFNVLHRSPLRKNPRILAEFSTAFLRLCEGQSEDIAFPASLSVDPEAHREMVRKKTAELLAASLAMGAAAATEDENLVRVLRDYGIHLGLAYQAKDDLLDATGREDIAGKSLQLDRRNGRRTYLTMAYPQVETLAAVSSIVEEHTAAALLHLEALPPSESRECLRGIASMLTRRET